MTLLGVGVPVQMLWPHPRKHLRAAPPNPVPGLPLPSTLILDGALVTVSQRCSASGNFPGDGCWGQSAVLMLLKEL